MSNTLDTTSPVGDWVTQHPQAARVFEELQIDYCCGGGRPLATVCESRELDAYAVVAKLPTRPQSLTTAGVQTGPKCH